jgi:hypothetical protein
MAKQMRYSLEELSRMSREEQKQAIKEFIDNMSPEELEQSLKEAGIDFYKHCKTKIFSDYGYEETIDEDK